MKRRAFLAAASLFAITPPAWAAKKRVKAAPQKAPDTPKTTAQNSVLESPYPGSSITRLPPVKAPVLPSGWRDFSIETTLSAVPLPVRQRVWLPLPLPQNTLYQQTQGYFFSGNFEDAHVIRRPDGEAELFCASWPENVAPQLSLTAQVSVADRRFDISLRSLPPERGDILRRNLKPLTPFLEEGQILGLARKIVGRVLDPLAQARFLFEWVADYSIYEGRADNALQFKFFDPKTDQAKYLAAGYQDPQPFDLGRMNAQMERLFSLPASTAFPEGWRFEGSSLEINALFVALCRAIGIPARRVFGRHIAPSQTVPDLGVDGDATHAASCRAEFYLPGYSWIPVAPADVCRVSAAENLSLHDTKRAALRKILFGVWEMNWMAYSLTDDGSFFPAHGAFSWPFSGTDDDKEGLPDLSEHFQYHIQSRAKIGS